MNVNRKNIPETEGIRHKSSMQCVPFRWWVLAFGCSLTGRKDKAALAEQQSRNRYRHWASHKATQTAAGKHIKLDCADDWIRELQFCRI